MALDLDAIRRKMAQLSGIRQSRVQLWKPPVGEHRIRVMPWPNQPSDAPIIEKYFYYLEGQMPILAPFQFGKPDPIQDFIKSLWATRKEEDKELAKKLRPGMKGYVPIIDRSDEKQGPIVWALNKTSYLRLLSFFMDVDTQLWNDPGPEGWDLKVTVAPSTGFAKTKISAIDTVKKQTSLHSDPETVKKWLDAIPDITDLYPIKSETEIKAILEAYLNGDPGAGPDNSAGTTRNESKDDELDKLASELGAKKLPVVEDEPKPKAKAAPKKAPAPKAALEEDDESLNKSLDDMFDEILKDEK